MSHSNHPCWDGSGFMCSCGYLSLTAREHGQHVRDAHAHQTGVARKNLTPTAFQNWLKAMRDDDKRA